MTTKSIEFDIDSLPEEMPYSGPVSNVELAHEMALETDADETKRAQWQAFAEELEQSDEETYGSSNGPRKILLKLAEDAREFPKKSQSDETDREITAKSWIRRRVRSYHEHMRWSRTAADRQEHIDKFGHSDTIITSDFVIALAKQTAKNYKIRANFEGNLVHFRHQSNENIKTIKEQLDDGDEQVYARVDQHEFVYPTYFLYRDEIPQDVDALDKELGRVVDIYRRKQAYAKLAQFFGRKIKPGSVSRDDVLTAFELMCDFPEVGIKRY